MTLPVSNTTCDIYRNANTPSAAPDVAGVKCYLAPDFVTSHTAAVTGTTVARWTHTLLVPTGTDIRDAYSPGQLGVDGFAAGANDWVYVPDRNGTKFAVLFVERLGRG